MAGNVTSTDYDQSGGTMTGTVYAGTYELSGTGDLSGVAHVSTKLTLSGAGIVESSATLVGSNSTMTQSGGDMTGAVTGITSYDFSAGTIDSSGSVAFTTGVTLEGDGNSREGGPSLSVARARP